MDNQHNTHHSRFLSLPSEVRNTIYRHTLVKGKITVNPNRPAPQPPGLLEVNRQVRSETINIYYRENIFLFRFNNMNADNYIKWCMSSPTRCNTRVEFKFAGTPNWDNLMRWLEASFRGQAHGLLWDTKVSPRKAVRELFQLMRQMREQGHSWSEIELNLERVHGTLAAVSSDWQ